MEVAKNYRYPGVRPFTINDSDVFFGRTDDTSRLFKLLMLEKLVVLFGKSGHGKSSIINAGIIPLFKKKSSNERYQYLPIEVRIGKVSGQSVSPIDKIIRKLDEQCPDVEDWKFIDSCKVPHTLWYHFKKKQSITQRKFILIFDQFEEFFSYSNSDQEAFCWQLAELLYTEIPQSVRENIDEISDDDFAKLSSRFDVKVLISIRSDRLSLLHAMKEALPAILTNRFEIKGLTPEQAKEAIRLPALKQDAKFITHPFAYDDAAMSIILKELVTVLNDGSEIIEAFHLQIICQACENKIEEKLVDGITDTEINPEDLPKFENLYEEYYKRQIEKLPADLQSKAQTILEEGLIFEDSQTHECHRLSVDGNILRQKFEHLGIQDNLLPLLENTFLVRREPNTVGGFSYEVAHDTIIEPIMKSKYEREKQQQMVSRMEEIKQAALKEYKRKRRIQVGWGLAVLLSAFLIIYNWEAIYFRYHAFSTAENRPVIRRSDELNEVVSLLTTQMLKDADSIGLTQTIGTWTAAQIIAGINGKLNENIRHKFHQLTIRSLVDSTCCWREVVNQNDFRASGWVVSSIGQTNLTNSYNCDVTQFFLDNQLSDGSWSMLQIDKNLTKYGSTYATCHVIRALYNSMQNLNANPEKISAIKAAIDRGIKWLLGSMIDRSKALWDDYPKDQNFESNMSVSLSGLVVHTLNITGYGTASLNRAWLKNLKQSQAAVTDIDYKERSDLFYELDDNPGVAEYRDQTRHLLIPWQIIATVDAYKNGDISEKTQASMWLDVVISKLNIEKIKRNPPFVRAEILIGLRYLQDNGFVFK